MPKDLQVQHTCMRSEGTTPTDGKDHLYYEQIQIFFNELRKRNGYISL